MSDTAVLPRITKTHNLNTNNHLRETLAALERSWLTSIRTGNFKCWLEWSKEGLRLGQGTLLTKRFVGDEARVLSLLSFAFDRSFPVSILDDLKRIEATDRYGAVSKSVVPPPLSIPPLLLQDRARRLYFAAGLMDAGFLRPLDLLDMAGLDPVHLRALKSYDPDQPRIPAGQTGGGEWTSGDGGQEKEPSSRSGGARNPLDNEFALAGFSKDAPLTIGRKSPIAHIPHRLDSLLSSICL